MSKQMFRDFVVGPKKTAQDMPAKTDFLNDRKVSRGSSGEGKKGVFGFLSGLFLFLVIISLFGFSFLKLTSVFSSAIVTITPVSERVSLNDTFLAVVNKEGVDDREVLYQIFNTDDTDSARVSASGSEKVSKKASGKIVVYNNFSSAPQVLVATTRFETPEGKIYRIEKAITVPGKKITDGRSLPGSLEVTVVADKPGAEYNIGASDFTLPGLKGTSRYDMVFARSSGDISGGYVGEMKIVSEEDVILTKKKLESSLRQKLISKLRRQIPDGHVLYDDGMFFTFSDNTSDLGKSDTSGEPTFVMKGSLSAVVFDGGELSKVIAQKSLPGLKNYDVKSDNLNSLEFKMIGKNNIDLSKATNFSFELSGSPRIVWNFDTEGFKENLAGVSKVQYQDVFKKYPMIEKAETVFKPSWSSSFPESLENITIELLDN